VPDGPREETNSRIHRRLEGGVGGVVERDYLDIQHTQYIIEDKHYLV
jgi:hypothetical protein